MLGVPVTRVLEIEVVLVAHELVATGLFYMHMGMFTFVLNAGGRFHLRYLRASGAAFLMPCWSPTKLGLNACSANWPEPLT
jgi:hypothetical protein